MHKLTRLTLCGAALILGMGAGNANALGIGLTGIQSFPDFLSTLTASYTEATDTLSLSGDVSRITFSDTFGDFVPVSGGQLSSFDLGVDAGGNVTAPPADTIILSGSFSYMGMSYSGDLLTLGIASPSEASSFGLTGTAGLDGDSLQLFLAVQGGSAASLFGSFAGMIVDLGFSDFTTDQSNQNVSGDTFAVVPIPAAAWLFGSALLGMVGIARRDPSNQRKSATA